ncbi:hypothetical protein CHS0354_020360 [Potamilus streckersoni]|uniref:Diphosphomevalonate decarboxylase n=1 Tax=Potamilus streckersoni TaxID=2493646 RepID=A0AAE0VVS4_9BIVA|nr:hypothetical protein CHS0354_020360 [Potamilus streckersoni]
MDNMEDNIKCVTCTAPVNIAVIKYWGKRDEELVLPVNSSVSVTLDQAQLRAKTTVMASPSFPNDRMWLNGKEQSMDSKRIQNLLNEIKQWRKEKHNGDTCTDGLLMWKVHICSENNFPTAAGLASSAAGYACLAYSLAKLYNVEGDLSAIARRGSGSACRSMYGGFVEWDMGSQEDGSDSVSRQIASENHWPELRVLLLVVSDQQKSMGSTEGMQATLKTSQLMDRRIQCVPESVEKIKEAILKKDFKTFAEITMKDSNQFHAVCLDSCPPIFYLTDVSKQIIQLVHAFNSSCGITKVAYTFDAGPNACLYLLEEDVGRVLSLICHFFPPDKDDLNTFVQGLQTPSISPLKKDVSFISLPVQRGAIQYVIHTQSGPGPSILQDPAQSLLQADGFPNS